MPMMVIVMMLVTIEGTAWTRTMIAVAVIERVIERRIVAVVTSVVVTVVTRRSSSVAVKPTTSQ